ncbi:type IV secretory system conjugative DNA transfer family protein [Acidipropionibacterium acidipropionici]|uniref:ATP-binding protein n=1 Tax=Acidipropionibacterium acidipropionici TaxID=1748 RepID=UPI00110A55E6|nr:ATP-binding protein [Acidipropionibacterium acidipropionici]QCV96512.1 ATP-binding protein [Acidipropionibacterium acidipropionici]
MPSSPSVPVICGMPAVAAPADDVAIDDDVCREGLRLGVAMTPEGRPREVRLAAEDQLLHTQVIGATGTGQSSLLAAWVAEAVRAGIGVSVIDPHGTLVTRLIAELPAEMATRTVVVRSGDLEHPVPVNPLNTEDWEQVQDTMLQTLREIFDPAARGFFGPVFERTMSILMEAQRALVGRRASLAALPEIFGMKALLRSLAAHLPKRIAQKVLTEVAGRSNEDYNELAGWFLPKFQRMLSSEQMRAITTTGEDAVDVTELVDQRKLLLVDLASPQLGGLSAQMLGEMWLAKHWSAMAHRTGIREAASVAQRLGSWPGGSLNRLPRMRAAATLSAGFAQSSPFTLVVDHNSRVSDAAKDPQTARLFAESSWKRYCAPYRDAQPLTWEYFMNVAQRPPEKRIVTEFKKWLATMMPEDIVQVALQEGAQQHFNGGAFEELGYTGLDLIKVSVLGVFAQRTLSLWVGMRMAELMDDEDWKRADSIFGEAEGALAWFHEARPAVPDRLKGWEDAGPEGVAALVDWIQGEWLHTAVPDYDEHVRTIDRQVREDLRNGREELMALLNRHLAQEDDEPPVGKTTWSIDDAADLNRRLQDDAPA